MRGLGGRSRNEGDSRIRRRTVRRLRAPGRFRTPPWSHAGGVGTRLSEKDLKFLREKDPRRLRDDERRVLALDDAEREMKASIADQRRAQEAPEDEEIRVDPRLLVFEQAETVLAAILKRATFRYAENQDPRDKYAGKPRIFEAEFRTDLGHWSALNKARVLSRTLHTPRGSGCDGLRSYPGSEREWPDVFQSAWTLHDSPAFKIEGGAICANSSHHAHKAIAEFDGLKMADLGIEGRGPQPAPEPPEPRPVAQVKPRPSAEEVLREAVRADAR